MQKSVLTLALVSAMFAAGCGGKASKGGGAAVDGTTVNGTTVNVEMVFVQGGTFTLGCTVDNPSECLMSEAQPAHSVTVSGFYSGKYEVTHGLWKSVMDDNPSYSGKDHNYPVTRVSYDEVLDFIKKLNAKTGKTYRLPTEAEWEYAARGGKDSKGYIYAGSNDIDDVAWYNGNNDKQPYPVGGKQPNELGIYDMSGNVWEWVSDWDGEYGPDAQINPTGPPSGYLHVMRGGAWINGEGSATVFNRSNPFPDPDDDGGGHVGFRLALSAENK